MSVAKVVKLVAHSDKGIEDAVHAGLEEASKTLKGISGVEVENFTCKVENNRIVDWKVTMHVAFEVEHT